MLVAAMIEYKVIVDESGTIRWYDTDGFLHRLDGPAIEWKLGYTKYEYYQNGKRHRIGGPAIVYSNGSTEYWVNGIRHRTDGPAINYITGVKEYWVDGRRHRTNGPAIENPYRNEQSFYIDGNMLTRADFIAVTAGKKMPEIQELTLTEIIELLGFNIKIIEG